VELSEPESELASVSASFSTGEESTPASVSMVASEPVPDSLIEVLESDPASETGFVAASELESFSVLLESLVLESAFASPSTTL
jgi:hypothetical protein